jgi:glycine/D-amino acid oxidase-like deaminating enzyme
MALHQALWQSTEHTPARPALGTDLSVDVAIVGSGFTGLWTAYYLKQANPDCRIAIIEKEVAGFGASGRNGGWCSALLPMSLQRMEETHGRAAAVALQREMFATVDEVARVAGTHGIDADIAKGGWIELARNRAQLDRIRADLAEFHSFGFDNDDHRELSRAEAFEICGATDVVGAIYTPHCAAIHPGKLVRGLAAVVEASGVAIYENTAALEIVPGHVRTAFGDVRADVVVRATEGYTATLPRTRRAIAPVYSLMLATEPLSSEVWDEIGLANRPTFNDARHLVIYGQRTADGRLAFGGRGAPYHWASSIRPSFEQHRPTHDGLHQILLDLFPALGNAAITHEWGGPLGIPRDWYASVGLDRSTGLAWAGGYVGDGVGTTNLAGRTLADLITNTVSDLTRMPWVNHASPNWEPEPLRWLGINLAARLPGHLDQAESNGKPAKLATKIFTHLVG